MPRAKSPRRCSISTISTADVQPLPNSQLSPKELKLPSQRGIERFPSATITKESFIKIDDDWPKDIPSENTSVLFSFFSRKFDCICRHRIISTVVLLGILLGITAAVTVPLVIHSSSVSEDQINITFDLSSSHSPNLLPSSAPSTTFQPYTPGFVKSTEIKKFVFDSELSPQSLKPDPRNPRGYILTTLNYVWFLSGCEKIPTSHINSFPSVDSYSCKTNASFINFGSFYGTKCDRCDVLDISDGCRQNLSFCTEKSLTYCCRGCNNDCFCSIMGTPLVSMQSNFLGAELVYQNESMQKLMFSSVSSLSGWEECQLHWHKIEVTGNKTIPYSYPAKFCSVSGFDPYEFRSVAITEDAVRMKMWKALLSSAGTLFLSDFSNVLYKIDDVPNGNSSTLLMQSNDGQIYVVDISEGVYCVTKFDSSKLSIVEPRQTTTEMPGIFMDSFLEDRELVLWSFHGRNELFVARIQFEWAES